VSSDNFSFGLIGFPLGHSLSPTIHNAALHTLGVKGEYHLYPIDPLPDGRTALTDLLLEFRTGKIHGLNVTIPHKQNVIPLLDELTPAAATIGAVNTIIFKDGVLVGDNTDAPGFWRDVNQNINVDLSECSNVLVLGSGGGARAVIYSLLIHGIEVTISARCEDRSQAEALRDDLSVVGHPIEIICLDTDYRSLNSDQFSLIVNCTPVGMHPHVDVSPWINGESLPRKVAVYDLVYNPRETLFVKQARDKGLKAISGLGMLVEQAALAFELWTGLEAPRKVMLEAVNY